MTEKAGAKRYRGATVKTYLTHPLKAAVESLARDAGVSVSTLLRQWCEEKTGVDAEMEERNYNEKYGNPKQD